MKNKGTKWAIIAVSAGLLAMLARGCAEDTLNDVQAKVTNNQQPAFSYTEYHNQYEELPNSYEEIVEEATNGKSK